MTCLEELVLSNNQLEELPESFIHLRALAVCILADNQLKTLPDALGELSKLQTLSLFNNHLVTLPLSLKELIATTKGFKLDIFNNSHNYIDPDADCDCVNPDPDTGCGTCKRLYIMDHKDPLYM